MAYTLTDFFKDGDTQTAYTVGEYFQLLWEGWRPLGPTPVPARGPTSAALLGDFATQAADDASAFRLALTRNGKKPVGRDELRVNVIDYGVVGDGTTNDSVAFIAAAAAALAADRTLWIPRGLTVKLVTPAIDLRNIDLHFEGAVTIAQTSSYGIRVGGASSNTNLRCVDIRTVLNTSSTPANPSIRVTGVKNGKFHIGSCDYVQFFADGSVPDSTSIAYSHFWFGNQITKLELFGQNGVGWINENTFYGGSFKNIIVAGSYNHNCNRFVKPSMEGTSLLDLQVGSRNFFDGLRAESGPTIQFGAGTWQNRIETAYTATRASRTPSYTSVTDLGVENEVISQVDVGHRRMSLLRVDSMSKVFNGSSEFGSVSTPVPGIRSLSLRAANVDTIDTGIFPIDAGGSTLLSYETVNKIRRLLLSCSASILRPLIYCYDSNMVELDPRTVDRIELVGGLSAHATNNYYRLSAVSNAVRILVIDPATKYLRIVVQSSSTAGTAFDWIDLSAYVAPTSGDGLVETARKTISRPLYQAAAPTQGLARPGQSIGHATGRFTCVSRVDTALTVAAVSTNTTITVGSITGMATGDLIGILLDTGLTHWTTINGAPAAGVVTLTVAMPSAAAIGRQVSTNKWVSIT